MDVNAVAPVRVDIPGALDERTPFFVAAEHGHLDGACAGDGTFEKEDCSVERVRASAREPLPHASSLAAMPSFCLFSKRSVVQCACFKRRLFAALHCSGEAPAGEGRGRPAGAGRAGPAGDHSEKMSIIQPGNLTPSQSSKCESEMHTACRRLTD